MFFPWIAFFMSYHMQVFMILKRAMHESTLSSWKSLKWRWTLRQRKLFWNPDGQFICKLCLCQSHEVYVIFCWTIPRGASPFCHPNLSTGLLVHYISWISRNVHHPILYLGMRNASPVTVTTTMILIFLSKGSKLKPFVGGGTSHTPYCWWKKSCTTW